MTADNLMTVVAFVRNISPAMVALGVLAVALMIVVALVLRKAGRRDASSIVTGLATILGLAWSAQGMWDTAVNHYGMDQPVAWVLFVVFEAMLTARMLKAGKYRTDLRRRTKHVRAVWLIAVIMATVVALGEGWQQALARLAIPLLVAYGWYTDLTADDDPSAKLETSWRLTPRRIGLALGLLEPGQSDAVTIDRDRLRTRMTRLAFRIHYAPDWLNDTLRRPTRLARLKTLADDADLNDVRARLARMSVDLMTPPATPIPRVPLLEVPARRAPRAGGDTMALMLASMTADRPKGMTAVELAKSAGVSLRTAETVAAEARKRLNGSTVA